jgi:hypothetical protein
MCQYSLEMRPTVHIKQKHYRIINSTWNLKLLVGGINPKASSPLVIFSY